MRDRLLRAPWWVLSLVTGGVYGGGMALWARLGDGESWGAALAGGLVSGVIFGGGMGPFIRWQNKRMLAAVGPVRGDVRRAAIRATRRGPLPDDPEVRAAALRLLDHQLTEFRRLRVLTVVVLPGLVLLFLVLAVTGTPEWWLLAALVAALLAMHVVLLARARRRRELLRVAGSG